MVHERDGRTDTQTPHDGIGRTYAQHRAAKSYDYCGSNAFLYERYHDLDGKLNVQAIQ